MAHLYQGSWKGANEALRRMVRRFHGGQMILKVLMVLMITLLPGGLIVAAAIMLIARLRARRRQKDKEG